MELEDKLMFNLDIDLEADDIARPSPGTLRHSSRRSRFQLVRLGSRPTLERLMIV